MAKYFTHPRRIGLILSITPLMGWDMEFRKMSLSLSSNAVRFLPFGNNSGIHRPRRLRIRRNSKPRNPKLSPCCKFTLRLLSSFTSTCSLANSSRSRFSTACRSHCWRGCESTKITKSSMCRGFHLARLSPRCFPIRMIPARDHPHQTTIVNNLQRELGLTPWSRKRVLIVEPPKLPNRFALLNTPYEDWPEDAQLN